MLVSPMDGGMHTYNLGFGVCFTVPTRYSPQKLIGEGAYGAVCSAQDIVTNRNVAIKRMKNPFHNVFTARRVYREIKLMQCATHHNIISLLDAFTPQEDIESFQEVYLVTELMDTDLSHVVGMGIDHTLLSYIIYQICCGIASLHSIGIIHRDLKPSNIGVNTRGCVVKILDFGLARSKDGRYMSPYVTTRYYRAPEVVVGLDYGPLVDIWSIGCIFAELISGRPLFEGSDALDQWMKIVKILGTPGDNFTKDLTSSVQLLVDRVPHYEGFSIEQILPDSLFDGRDAINQAALQWSASRNGTSTLCTSQARDLISRMLVVDPNDRIGLNQTLNHPYINFWEEGDDQRQSDALAHLDPAVNINTLDVNEYRRLTFYELNGIFNQ